MIKLFLIYIFFRIFVNMNYIGLYQIIAFGIDFGLWEVPEIDDDDDDDGDDDVDDDNEDDDYDVFSSSQRI